MATPDGKAAVLSKCSHSGGTHIVFDVVRKSDPRPSSSPAATRRGDVVSARRHEPVRSRRCGAPPLTRRFSAPVRYHGRRWRLACAVAFLGMAGLTKSEGQLFAVAAAGALLVAQAGRGWRPRIRPALIAVVALATLLAPWRIYCAAYGLTTPDYDLANMTKVGYLHEHANRLRPVLHELWRQLDAPHKWGWLVLAAVLGILAGIAARRFRVTAFAAVWLALAGGGLVLVYWVSTLPTESHLTNSSYRTIVSLLVGATAMLPLLVGLPLDVQVDTEQEERPEEDRE